ncbi:hypothetical protein M885DRAFT_527299, partial [Pelagophyceae sp. CCMP2097]
MRGASSSAGSPGGAPLRGDALVSSPPQMATTGQAAATVKGKKVAIKSLDKFLEAPVAVAKYGIGASFDTLDETTLCDSAIWLEFAHYLTTEDRALKALTIVEYLRKALFETRARFGKSPAVGVKFFAEIDSTQSATWLKRCIRQVNAGKFDSAAANGETVTSQADPINLLHRVELARQFRRFGTADAAMRNLALQINGVGVGRPGEDSRLMCAFGLWPQFKTHKFKKFILMAGPN